MKTETGRGRNRFCRAASLFVFIVLTSPVPFAQAADDPLIMGIFPRRNTTETTRLFTPLAEHLSQRLNRKVILATPKTFESFWKDVSERQFDIVHYNQYHYIRSAGAYQVIAHIEELGKSSIAGALFVRKDSGITGVSQLRGRTILFGGGEDAMIAYIANYHMLLRAGLKKDDFKSQFAINPPNAVIGVFQHQADAAGAGSDALQLPAVRNAIRPDELIALVKSEPLLQLPWAVKRSMPASLRTSIQTLLIDLRNSDEGRQILKSAVMTGILKADDKDYDPHREIVRAVFGPTATAQQ